MRHRRDGPAPYRRSRRPAGPSTTGWTSGTSNLRVGVEFDFRSAPAWSSSLIGWMGGPRPPRPGPCRAPAAQGFALLREQLLELLAALLGHRDQGLLVAVVGVHALELLDQVAAKAHRELARLVRQPAQLPEHAAGAQQGRVQGLALDQPPA